MILQGGLFVAVDEWMVPFDQCFVFDYARVFVPSSQSCPSGSHLVLTIFGVGVDAMCLLFPRRLSLSHHPQHLDTYLL